MKPLMPRTFSSRSALLFFVFLLLLATHVRGAGVSSVSFPFGDDQRDALLCRPQGAGPFLAVVYNHGSVVDMFGWPGAAGHGYRMDDICEALAKEGYLAFLPIREKRARGKNHQSYEEYYKDVVSRAVDHVKTLPGVDSGRVALMGFSMGGFTTLKVAVERKDLKAVVLLAPAFARGLLADEVERVPSLNAPVLLLVEASDDPPIRKGVALLEQAFREHKKEARVIRYDRGGGHHLFYQLDYWWLDVSTFLRDKLDG